MLVKFIIKLIVYVKREVRIYDIPEIFYNFTKEI